MSTDVKSVKIYGESCQSCNEMDKSKLNHFISPGMIFWEKNLAQLNTNPDFPDFFFSFQLMKHYHFIYWQYIRINLINSLLWGKKSKFVFGEIGESDKLSKIDSAVFLDMRVIAIPGIEFQVRGYKTKNIFA